MWVKPSCIQPWIGFSYGRNRGRIAWSEIQRYKLSCAFSISRVWVDTFCILFNGRAFLNTESWCSVSKTINILEPGFLRRHLFHSVILPQFKQAAGRASFVSASQLWKWIAPLGPLKLRFIKLGILQSLSLSKGTCSEGGLGVFLYTSCINVNAAYL